MSALGGLHFRRTFVATTANRLTGNPEYTFIVVGERINVLAELKNSHYD